MRARKARLSDAPAIHRLIQHYAASGLLLPRTAADVRAHIGCFLVLAEKGNLVGCVALESYGTELAEVRSLAVAPEVRGHGAGAGLLGAALNEAKRRGYARVFAVTHAPEFFGRQGFHAMHRQAVPEKVARDCCTCPKQATCQLVAVIAVVCPERAALPVLTPEPLPAA